MTNIELIERAEKAMAFLRTCGATHGENQACAIEVLCKRLRTYEAKLVQFNCSTSEMLEDVGIQAPSNHLWKKL